MTIPLSASRLHLLCASVAMLALHSCIPEPACAAPAPYPIDVNSRAQSAPAVTCYRANSFTIRASFLDGQTASDLTGAIPFLSWATNTTAASVSTSSWAFASSPTNGIVDFTFAPESVNFTPGRYIYEVGVKTSNGVVSVYRQGIFFIVGSPTAAGVGAVNWTTSLNWDLIDWTNLPSYIASESDPVAYPVATNALALASTALQPLATNGLLRAEADTLATVTARGGTTTSAVTIGYRGAGAVGESSVANGESVVASGHASHAEGFETTASENYSHAEGASTTASGDYSHAEGVATTAIGHASHAEGVDTTASGYYSHAEGAGTTASGSNSHAEGVNTTASGDMSHAEGGYTAAIGYVSHAEGVNTTASGEGSHAEGYSTTASGYASHASGFLSVASHEASFAWQGSDGGYSESPYGSHGNGTFNLNPAGGLAGFWIGETNMATTLSGYATTGAVADVAADVATLEDETLDPWIDWSAVITPVNGTATVTRATGAEPMLTLADDVVISVPTDNWPTTGVARVSLSLWAGTNSVTLLTNTVEYSSTPTISTNDWTRLLYWRTGDQTKWMGVGL